MAGVCGIAFPSAAAAYSHSWSWGTSPAACNPIGPDTRCYDNQGATYNPWVVLGGGSYANTAPTVCAKSVTAAGNLRSSVTGGYCNYNYGNVYVVLTSATPESRAYVYWANGSGTKFLAGTATT